MGEIRQGPVPPDGPVIQSGRDVAAFSILGGEPALTMLPDLLLSGILSIAVAAALGGWTVAFAHRRHGGLGLLLLSVHLRAGGRRERCE